mgnify:CR=1 FL=1
MDYAELVIELAERTQDPAFVHRANQMVSQAETDLNQRFKPFEYPTITPISENKTNWLLRESQETYITAVLRQYYLLKSDAEMAQAYSGYLDKMVMDKKHADRTTRFNRRKYTIGGCTP